MSSSLSDTNIMIDLSFVCLIPDKGNTKPLALQIVLSAQLAVWAFIILVCMVNGENQAAYTIPDFLMDYTMLKHNLSRGRKLDIRCAILPGTHDKCFDRVQVQNSG